MNQNEKICSAFRQDIELPAIVTQKADAAFEQILSESHKEKDKMKEEQKNTRKKSHKKKVPVWVKGSGLYAAVFGNLFRQSGVGGKNTCHRTNFFHAAEDIGISRRL